MFHQLGCTQIPVGDVDIVDSVVFQSMAAGPNSGVSDLLLVDKHLFPDSAGILYRNMVS
jgi:hypothetical protein